MAIGYNTNVDKVDIRQETGQANGSEVMFQLSPNRMYAVECIETGGGAASATLKTRLAGGAKPTDFSNMAAIERGAQTASFSEIIFGASWVGLDIANSSGGTWTVTVYELKA